MKLVIEKVKPKHYRVYKDDEHVATITFSKQNQHLKKIKSGQKMTIWFKEGGYRIRNVKSIDDGKKYVEAIYAL